MDIWRAMRRSSSSVSSMAASSAAGVDFAGCLDAGVSGSAEPLSTCSDQALSGSAQCRPLFQGMRVCASTGLPTQDRGLRLDMQSAGNLVWQHCMVKRPEQIALRLEVCNLRRTCIDMARACCSKASSSMGIASSAALEAGSAAPIAPAAAPPGQQQQGIKLIQLLLNQQADLT